MPSAESHRPLLFSKWWVRFLFEVKGFRVVGDIVPSPGEEVPEGSGPDYKDGNLGGKTERNVRIHDVA